MGACFNTETEENVAFTWDAATMCTKAFDTVTTYFLSDEVSQVGEPVTVSDSTPASPDDCCTASGGTETGLVDACFTT